LVDSGGRHISTGLIFYDGGIKNVYRAAIDLSEPLIEGLSALEILLRRFANRPGLVEPVLVSAGSEHSRGLVAAAEALSLPVFVADAAGIVEKPLELRQQRWNLEDDSGCEEWVGAALALPLEKYRWSEVIIIPVENLLVEPESVWQSLRLYFQQGFEVCFSAERVVGANWSIVSSEVLKALMLNHEDLMWARGGLAWALRKPLYPFNTGYFHCPRVRARITVDMRLNSQRNLKMYRQMPAIADPAFSYEEWLDNSGWESLLTHQGPRQLQVEPSAKCEADCVSCVNGSMQRPAGIMPLQYFKCLFEQLESPEEARFIFSGCGEPLLNPDLSEMLKLTAGSSAMLITSLQNFPAADFPFAALDQIRISVDALEPSGFAAVRPGCNWKNIETFIAETSRKKAADPGRFPEIGVSLVRHGKTEAVVTQFLQYWKKVTPRPVFNEWFFKWPFDIAGDKVQWFQILGENSYLGEIDRSGHVDFTPVKRRPCRHALLSASIMWDGTVTLCPFDAEGRMQIGNINETPLLQLWRSEKASAFRQAHLRLDFAGASEQCRTCRDWYHNI
jgi:radical SAM protein with 4Fe4S-binding SPASM domain